MKESPALVGILSDTHNQVARTETAVAWLKNRGAKCLFHCGDLTGRAIVQACSPLPAYFVFGNNDEDQDLLENEMKRCGAVSLGEGGTVEVFGKRISLTHGHEYSERRRLIESSPDYLFVGHSHRKVDEYSGPTRVINPGALHRATVWSVALLDVSADRLEYYDLPKEISETD